MKDIPGGADFPIEEQNRVMHISLPIGEGSILMGSDTSPSMGQMLEKGNYAYISLHPDSRNEADRLFNGLSAGGTIEMPMEDQFWGDYYGSFFDKFGIGWMIIFTPEEH